MPAHTASWTSDIDRPAASPRPPPPCHRHARRRPMPATVRPLRADLRTDGSTVPRARSGKPAPMRLHGVRPAVHVHLPEPQLAPAAYVSGRTRGSNRIRLRVRSQLGARKNANRDVCLPNFRETARDRVLEMGRHQQIIDFRCSRRHVFQAEITLVGSPVADGRQTTCVLLDECIEQEYSTSPRCSCRVVPPIYDAWNPFRQLRPAPGTGLQSPETGPGGSSDFPRSPSIVWSVMWLKVAQRSACVPPPTSAVSSPRSAWLSSTR